jgi:hydrogenase expression/formation protein HypE
MNALPEEFRLSCPIPIRNYPTVTLAHGGGGILMNDLIDKMFRASFCSHQRDFAHDSAVFVPPTGRLAFTTDSFVVSPLIFPGGDIGSLAVYGTINDLAMSGAKPLYLSVAFILEEGLPMDLLWRIVLSIKDAAQKAQVQIITGDTKVVDRGKADKIFINTSGVGLLEHQRKISSYSVKEGDQIIVSGDLGRHGIAIMAVRESLEFESQIQSDLAPLSFIVGELLDAGVDVHCLRDLTRGGMASALNEIAAVSQLGIEIFERLIPVREDVKGACELLGFDPLYVACEGRLVAFVSCDDAPKALAVMKRNSVGKDAAIIGQVVAHRPGVVSMESVIGVKRIVDMISGEQLPRIC